MYSFTSSSSSSSLARVIMSCPCFWMACTPFTRVSDDHMAERNRLDVFSILAKHKSTDPLSMQKNVTGVFLPNRSTEWFARVCICESTLPHEVSLLTRSSQTNIFLSPQLRPLSTKPAHTELATVWPWGGLQEVPQNTQKWKASFRWEKASFRRVKVSFQKT